MLLIRELGTPGDPRWTSLRRPRLPSQDFCMKEMKDKSNVELVTFALFAYNQEKYIREAVQAAFAQTYEPLEIILSDDCSSDRTFEIMEAMAADYTGPHRVRAVQTPTNLGVTAHVLLRGSEANGEIVVVAAGDDVSKSERCSEHIPIYKDPSVMAVTGSYDIIDEKSEVVKLDVRVPVAKDALGLQRAIFKSTKFRYQVIQGSTASYRKSIFAFPLPPWRILFSEDNLFNFLIYISGYRVATISDSLVKYRMHPDAISNHGVIKRSAEEVENLARRAAKREINKLAVFRWIAERQLGLSNLNIQELERRARLASIIESWGDKGVFGRSRSFCSSVLLGDFKLAKWKFARLYGRFPQYQPKKLSVYFRGR